MHRRLRFVPLLVLAALAGCGGSTAPAGGSSANSGGGGAPTPQQVVKGIETPSSVSVVTAQNAH